MRKGAPRQAHIDFVTGCQCQHLAQIAKNRIKGNGNHNAHRKHPQGGLALVGQHFIDHQLEKDGRGHGQQLHNRRCNENVSKSFFLLPNLRDKPGKTEFLLRIGQLVLAFEQNDLPAPQVCKTGFIQQLDGRLCAGRIENGNLIGPRSLPTDAHHDHHAARTGVGDKGENTILDA